MGRALASLLIFASLLLMACAATTPISEDEISPVGDSSSANSETETDAKPSPTPEEWIVAEKRKIRKAVTEGGTPVHKAGTPGVPAFPKEIRGCQIKRGANCEGFDLSGVDLTAYRAHGRQPHVFADFREANLRNVNFSGAGLQKARFEEADLRDANFTGAELSDTSFWAADLRGVDFTEAKLTFSDMADAQLDGAIFCRTIDVPDEITYEENC